MTEDRWPPCPECGGILDFSGRCSGCDWWSRDSNYEGDPNE